MAQQVKTITSEALEAAYRNLTPSQDGFTEDLMASNVVIPVLDLTASAEGATTPESLQQAWDFSTGNFNSKAAATTTIINNTGFWHVGLTVNFISTVTGSTAGAAALRINDGSSTKEVWTINKLTSAGTTSGDSVNDRFVVFLRSGDSLEYTNSSATFAHFSVWYRQIADVSGNLTNPLGFTPQ
jgi:hypothetical protein